MPVTLVQKYTPVWLDWFAEIQAYLEARLGAIPHTAEHVGSTSVRGMTAKPIIDLVLVVEQDHSARLLDALANAGYVHQGDLGLPGREAFKRVPDSLASRLPPHHLYACPPDCLELHKHRAFRDFLRVHPDWARTLSQLKWDLCLQYANDRLAYMDGKDAMVRQITELGFRFFNLPYTLG